MNKLYQISLHRPKNLGDHADSFAGKEYVLRVEEKIDHLQDSTIEEIAERMFVVTNAPHDYLEGEDIGLEAEYRKAMNKSSADRDLKYHSISVGDMVRIHGEQDGKLYFAQAVCQPSGWKVFNSWNAPVTA